MSLIFLMSVFSLFELNAATLVTLHSEVKNISEKDQKNILFLVRRFGRLTEMDRNDLGRSTSPYYTEDNKVKKLYHNYLDQCYETVVDEKYTYAYSVSCQYVPEFEISGFKDFKRISFRDAASDVEKMVSLRSFQKQYEVPGLTVHYRNTLNQNGEVEVNSRQKSTFKFKVNAETKAVFNKSGLVLLTEVKFFFDKFGYITPETELFKSEITLAAGDMLFTNNQGQFLIFKRYQPMPFHFQTPWLSEDYLQYLNQLETFLYQHEGRGFCFYDDYLNPTSFDCKRRVLKYKSPLEYKTYMLIEFDINKGAMTIY